MKESKPRIVARCVGYRVVWLAPRMFVIEAQDEDALGEPVWCLAYDLDSTESMVPNWLLIELFNNVSRRRRRKAA